MYRKIFFIILIILIISLPGKTVEYDFDVKMDSTSPVSRFRGFTAIIPEKALEYIDSDSLKLYINGEDYSDQLGFNKDTATGSLYVSFEPTYPLPLGQVVQKITGVTKQGDYFEKSWTILVDPMSDSELATYYTILQSDPNNLNAHLNLADIYEKKYLFKDAQNEYLTVLQLDPANEKARKGYERLFSLWDHKTIKYDKLTMEVFIDAGLAELGRLLLFNVKIKSEAEENIKISPAGWTLIDESAKSFVMVEDLSKYPKKALYKKWISTEQYAKLSYHLQHNSFPLLKEQEIPPMGKAEGFLVFSFAGNSKAQKVVLSIVDQKVGDHKENFIFPFVLP